MGRSPELALGVERYQDLYGKVLKGIIGENYEDELVEFLRQQGWISNGKIPQMRFPLDRHEGSKARYLYDFPNGDDQILFQLLRPGGKTSRHYHRSPVFEEYLPFSGSFYLNGVVIPPEGQIVLPGFVHQGESRDGWSTTFIKMRNIKNIPRDQWH